VSKELVKKTLEAQARNNIPPQPDLWLGIQARLRAAQENPNARVKVLVGQPEVKPARRRTSPAQWLVRGIAAVAVLGIVGLLIVALGANQSGIFGANTGGLRSLEDISRECRERNLSDFDCLVKTYENLPIRAAWLPLSKDVNLSQDSNGFTLRVRKVYADVSSVIVGYEIKGPPGLPFSSGIPQLTDVATGKPFGIYSTIPIMGRESAQFWGVDGSTIKGNPQSVKVRFQMKNIKIRAISSTIIKTPLPNETISPPVTRNLALPIPTQDPNSGVQVVTDFDLEFDVPFFGGKIVELNQKATADNRELILERLTVAPSGTRAKVVSMEPFSEKTANSLGRLDMIIGDQRYASQNGGPEGNDWMNDFTGKTNQDWTLTVTEMQNINVPCVPGEAGPRCSPPAISNPTPGTTWKFTFRVDK
jgi:hypothetical protein